MRNEKLLAAIFCAAIAGMQAPAFAAGSHAGGHGVSDNIGQPGHAGDVDRTIHVEMGEMFFLPGDLKVEQGETIRFVVTNKGELVHEFNIATEEMHMAHNSEMMMMFENGTLEADRINHAAMSESDMAHDDANSLLLEPGQTAESDSLRQQRR